MNKKQATQLQKQLLAMSHALEQVNRLTYELPNEDRAKLDGLLGRLMYTLHGQIMPTFYDLRPELRPIKEMPKVSSHLLWDDVVLPKEVTVDNLDAIIFSALTTHWQKIAMIIGTVAGRCKELGYPLSASVIGARIQELEKLSLLETQGNPTMWRHSEVRRSQEVRGEGAP